MSDTATLPTRKDEDFRYADMTALAQVWPIVPEEISVAAGHSAQYQHSAVNKLE